MKKSELKNGMIVKTSGGRYGVVVLEDSTDKNCIKFLYDPKLLLEHGFVSDAHYGEKIVKLSSFCEDLTIRWTEEAERVCTNTIPGYEYDPDSINTICWSIVEVYELNKIYERKDS